MGSHRPPEDGGAAVSSRRAVAEDVLGRCEEAAAPRGGGRRARLACGFGVLLCLAVGALGETEIIYSERPLHGRLAPNATKCYHFSLDGDDTRNVVYWRDAQLYVRLEPCQGLPHLRASVYGCPSEGNLINFEYQSQVSRERACNDARATGQPPAIPAAWEWPGDLESLSMDLTHRDFYIEVSSYHAPLRTNASLYDLEERLRLMDFYDEADDVIEIYSRGIIGPPEVATLRRYQELLMPDAAYVITATLHDASVVPTEKVYPLTNQPGWVRDIEKRPDDEIVVADLTVTATSTAVEDPLSGDYIIAFWPPIRSPNKKEPADTNASAPATAQARRGGGGGGEVLTLTWGDVEERLRHHTEEHGAARRMLALDDVIFSGAANPASQEGAVRQLRSRERELAGRALSTEEDAARLAALADAHRSLESLRGSVEGYEGAAARGHSVLREVLSGKGGEEEVRVRQADPSAPQAGRTGIIERANTPIVDADLEYMIYWIDITSQFSRRWGVMVDAMGQNYTRLLDNECGPRDMSCGVKQWIQKTEFRKLDRDENMILTRHEYEARYTPAVQTIETGFGEGRDFDWVLENGNGTNSSATSGGITMDMWMQYWIGAEEILQASVKDPLFRTFWTVCGVNATGNKIVPSGNASKESSRAVWEPWTSFNQYQDGRLTRAIKGLDDSNNNVYIINILVRNTRTGEYASYKPHILQRKTYIYQTPEMGGTQYDLIIGVSVSFGLIIIALIAALVLTRNKRLRPKLRIKSMKRVRAPRRPEATRQAFEKAAGNAGH